MQISFQLTAWHVCSPEKTYTLVATYLFIKFLLKTLKYIIDVWLDRLYGCETIR